MRIWKGLAIAAGALSGLVVVGVILVTLFVDPNDYKDDIERLAEQQQRLAHARAHCDFYLDTSYLSAERVQEQVLAFLAQTVG